MIDFIAHFGIQLTALVYVVIMLILNFNTTFTWSCGICGKINNTNIIKMMLCWCDHFGDML